MITLWHSAVYNIDTNCLFVCSGQWEQAWSSSNPLSVRGEVERHPGVSVGMLIWLPVLCEVSWEGLEAPPSGKHTVVHHGTAGLTVRLLLADREVPVFGRTASLAKSVAVGCKDGLKFLLLSSGFGEVRWGCDELVETLRRKSGEVWNIILLSQC